MAFILTLQDDTGTTIDFLGETYRLEEGGLSIPAPRSKYVESGPSFYYHGQKIIDVNYGNRDIDIKFEIDGATRDAVANSITTINKMMERARARNRDADYSKNVELKFQLDGQAHPTYFRILDGTFDFPRAFMSVESVHWTTPTGYAVKKCSLSLLCEPFAYAASTLKTFEDGSGDRPVELGLKNTHSSGYQTGGVNVDNGFDSDQQNFVMLQATDVDGDILAASTIIFENDHVVADGLGKVYVGRMTGKRELELSSTITAGGTSLVVKEDISHLRLPLRIEFADGDQVFATAKDSSTKTLTVSRTPIKTVAVNNAGSGYVVGDIVTISGGGGNALLLVTQVSQYGTVGQIQKLSFIRPGSGYTTNTGVSLTGGTGSSATVNTTVGTAAQHLADVISTIVSLNPVLEGESAVFNDLSTGAVLGFHATPTAGGTGYTVNDVLTVTTGGTGATVRVLTVNAGVVTSIAGLTGGYGYTTGTGKTTTGGTGTGCTVNILDVVDDTHTNRSYADASGGSYEEIFFKGSGIKSLARWVISPDVVAALSGNKIRFMGRAAPAGSGGTSLGDDWNLYINYRLKLSYRDRSKSEIVIHYTEWKNALTSNVQFMDFGSAMMPPHGFFGMNNSPSINVVLQAQIHPDNVLNGSLEEIDYYLNLDYVYMLPVTGGYRVLQTRTSALQRGDKIVDDAWNKAVYAEQISSYPSGQSLGKVGIVVPYMTPIWLESGKDQMLFFLNETAGGLTDISNDMKVKVYSVPAFINIVYT